jgi:hypothetical protein
MRVLKTPFDQFGFLTEMQLGPGADTVIITYTGGNTRKRRESLSPPELLC